MKSIDQAQFDQGCLDLRDAIMRNYDSLGQDVPTERKLDAVLNISAAITEVSRSITETNAGLPEVTPGATPTTPGVSGTTTGLLPCQHPMSALYLYKGKRFCKVCRAAAKRKRRRAGKKG